MSIETPIVNAPNLYIDDLRITYVVSNAIALSNGGARNSSNINDISYESPTIIDGSKSGVINGLDQGSITADTIYCVYAIGDSTQNNLNGGILSLNSNTPLIPGGYDMFRRLGWVLTDSSALIIPFREFGRERSRVMWYAIEQVALTNGSETDFTSIDLSGLLGATATNVIMNVLYTPSSPANICQFLPPGDDYEEGIVKYGCGVANAQQGQVIIPSASIPSIQYKVESGDTLSLAVAGYYYYL